MNRLRAALSLVTFLVFARILWHGFVQLDDDVLIVENFLLNPVRGETLWRFWTQGFERLYTPFVMTWFTFVAALAPRGADGRLAAWPFHLGNLALHVGSALLVFGIVRAVLRARRGGDDAVRHDAAAAIGAALFALHPVQVEPVAWASGAKDVVTGFLALLSLRLFVQWAVEPPPPAKKSKKARQDRGPLLLGCAYAAYLLAVLSKPSAIVVPLVAGVLSLRLPRGLSQAWPHLAAWIALGFPLVVANKALQPSGRTMFEPPLWARPLIAADSLAFYAVHVVFPVRIGPDYGRSAEWVLSAGQVYWTWILPAAIAVLAATRRARDWLAEPAAIFAAALLPVLGLVPFDFQAFSTVADRYLYVAMLGPALAVALAASSWRSGWPWKVALGLAGLLAARTFLLAGTWTDSETLYRHALRVNPSSYWFERNLGFALSEQERLDEAIVHLKRSLELKPDEADPHNNLGIIAGKREKLEEAIEHFRRALEIDPTLAEAHHNMGMALAKMGREDEAASHFEHASRLKPENPSFHYSLGIARARKGRFREAALHFRQVLKVQPGNASAAEKLSRLEAMGH